MQRDASASLKEYCIITSMSVDAELARIDAKYPDPKFYLIGFTSVLEENTKFGREKSSEAIVGIELNETTFDYLNRKHIDNEYTKSKLLAKNSGTKQNTSKPKFASQLYSSSKITREREIVSKQIMKENVNITAINNRESDLQSLKTTEGEQEGVKNVPRSMMRIGPTFNKQLKSHYLFGPGHIKPQSKHRKNTKDYFSMQTHLVNNHSYSK
eukprot:TRINITY_DN13729_c0_g1_i3.p1 TRINITY_DN13729_c0_g1~~TRINITY_DN13729_c0_g1_i3.p1  ORF type:complete len:212 (-),score=27.75 TRINITY_DN13729_c0_g1_i3:97-732(-)